MVALALTADERDMLDGGQGPAAQMAMRILVRMGQLQGAERFIPVESAHVDGCLYEGEAIVDFVEKLRALGGRVRVPTTLNAISVEFGNWRRLHIPEQFGERATELVQAYLDMGCRPSFSCSPYQIHHVPKFGTHVAWAESNAIAFANSVLGARTARYGDFLDICAAITGRVPEVGLHRTDLRRGQVLFRLGDDISPALRRSDAFYPVLGYYLGRETADKVPVLNGIPAGVTADRLKALLAASASSGSVAMMHIVGVTPEAPDLAAAFAGRPPERTVDVTLADLRSVREELIDQDVRSVDVVALGSPHFSYEEFEEFAAASRGLHAADGVQVIILTNRVAQGRLQETGLLRQIEDFGADVILDTCILGAPIVRAGKGTMMTNSAKFAHYSPGKLGLRVVFGSLRECVRSAAAGEVRLEGALWA